MLSLNGFKCFHCLLSQETVIADYIKVYNDTLKELETTYKAMVGGKSKLTQKVSHFGGRWGVVTMCVYIGIMVLNVLYSF